MLDFIDFLFLRYTSIIHNTGIQLPIYEYQVGGRVKKLGENPRAVVSGGYTHLSKMLKIRGVP